MLDTGSHYVAQDNLKLAFPFCQYPRIIGMDH